MSETERVWNVIALTWESMRCSAAVSAPPPVDRGDGISHCSWCNHMLSELRKSTGPIPESVFGGNRLPQQLAAALQQQHHQPWITAAQAQTPAAGSGVERTLFVMVRLLDTAAALFLGAWSSRTVAEGCSMVTIAACDAPVPAPLVCLQVSKQTAAIPLPHHLVAAVSHRTAILFPCFALKNNW